MARISNIAAICLVLLPVLATAQENVGPAKSSVSELYRFLRDPEFEGAIVGALVVGFLSLLGIIWNARAVRKDSRHQIVRELHKEFVYGSMLRARLNAELLLFYDVEGRYRDKNFEQLYTSEMSPDEYADVAAVLNLFRLLNDYKEHGYIDEAQARAQFGWIYRWWWPKVIEPHSRGLEGKDDWKPHITRMDWLLNGTNAVEGVSKHWEKGLLAVICAGILALIFIFMNSK